MADNLVFCLDVRRFFPLPLKFSSLIRIGIGVKTFCSLNFPITGYILLICRRSSFVCFFFISWKSPCFIFHFLFHMLTVYFREANYPYSTLSFHLLASDCFNVMITSLVFTETIKPLIFSNLVSVASILSFGISNFISWSCNGCCLGPQSFCRSAISLFSSHSPLIILLCLLNSHYSLTCSTEWNNFTDFPSMPWGMVSSSSGCFVFYMLYPLFFFLFVYPSVRLSVHPSHLCLYNRLTFFLHLCVLRCICPEILLL